MKKQILKTFWILSFYFAVPLLLKMPPKPPQQQKPRLQPFKLQQQKKNKLPQFKPLHRQKPKPLLFPPMHRRQPKPPPLQPYTAENRK